MGHSGLSSTLVFVNYRLFICSYMFNKHLKPYYAQAQMAVSSTQTTEWGGAPTRPKELSPVREPETETGQRARQ